MSYIIQRPLAIALAAARLYPAAFIESVAEDFSDFVDDFVDFVDDFVVEFVDFVDDFVDLPDGAMTVYPNPYCFLRVTFCKNFTDYKIKRYKRNG